MLWRQYVFIGGYAAVVLGECRSTNRLAANLAMWLIMLAAPAAICEWLMRRYRPRLRWSLRTMFIAIGLAAACCGWFVTARDRADIEDPRYLDRFPRLRSLNLTGLALSGAGLADLASLKSLEELAINSDALSTAGVESLLALKRLRTLHVRGVDYQRRAVEALRRSKPELSIDGNTDAVSPPVRAIVRSHYEPSVAIPTRHVREMLRQWHIKQAGRGNNSLL